LGPAKTVPGVSEPDIIEVTVSVVPDIDPTKGEKGGVALYVPVDTVMEDDARAMAIPGYKTGFVYGSEVALVLGVKPSDAFGHVLVVPVPIEDTVKIERPETSRVIVPTMFTEVKAGREYGTSVLAGLYLILILNPSRIVSGNPESPYIFREVSVIPPAIIIQLPSDRSLKTPDGAVK
jgi:hypothetical protein